MSEPRTYDQVLADAISVLTEAARLTRAAGQGDGPEQREAIDFAEFVTLAVAGATANIGSIEEMLAGRPGSWEAESVRSMLISTVGEDETYLAQHRTEPLTIVVNVDDLLNDLGYWELYDQAEDELARREQEIDIPSFTYQPGDPESEAAARAAFAQLEPANDEQEAALDRIEALRDKLDEQREQDCAAYGEAFKANVLAAAAELLPELPVPVEVTVELRWQNNAGDGAAAAGPAWRLWEQARAETPLPGSGIPLKNYPLHVSVADVERAAGRQPLARVERPL